MLPLQSPQSCREALHPEMVDTDSDFLTTLVAPGLGLLPQAPLRCLLADGQEHSLRTLQTLGRQTPASRNGAISLTQLVFFHATELPCCMHWNLAAQKPGPHQVQRSDKIHLSPKS